MVIVTTMGSVLDLAVVTEVVRVKEQAEGSVILAKDVGCSGIFHRSQRQRRCTMADECLSWVNNGLSRPTAATSGVGREADVNSTKPDIGQ